MMAAVLERIGEDLKIKEVETPTLDCGDVLIEVEACGVCHTDLHIKEGKMKPKKIPVILGHEVVGRVIEADGDIEGDRVGLYYYYSFCGMCEACLAGHEYNCQKALRTGIDVDGGFAEFVKAKYSNVIPLPKNIEAEKLSGLLCSGTTAYNAIKDSGIKAGDWIAVFGVGGIGHLLIQYAKIIGANVVSVDVIEEKLRFAEKLGSDVIVNAKEERIDEEIEDVKISSAVITAGGRDAFKQALSALKRGGRIVVVSISDENLELKISELVRGRIEIKGSGVKSRRELNETIKFSIKNGIMPHVEKFRLQEVNEVFEKMKAGEILGKASLEVR